MKPTSERFGQRVAEALGAGPGRATLAAQRARVLASAEAYEPGRPRRAWVLTAAALLVAVVLVVGLRGSGAPATSADFAGRRVQESARLDSVDSSEALHFSDGSSLLLAPKTSVTLAKLSDAEVKLSLARGHLSAAVEKGRRWTIEAGPYRVRVVGTRFSVDWDEGAGRVAVRVEQGQVAVSHEAGKEVLLGPGTSFERGGPATRSEPASVEPRMHAPEPPPANSSASALVAESRAEPTWSLLASRGKYKEALALAEKQGFEGLLQVSNESDLLLLANTARYAGAREQAQHAFLAIRRRFPGKPAAALSAFYLARLAEDKDRNPGAAARWLRTFLHESPNGDLAASARASLLALLTRKGDHSGARAVARDYLKHHPSGPHAAEARALLDERPRE